MHEFTYPAQMFQKLVLKEWLYYQRNHYLAVILTVEINRTYGVRKGFRNLETLIGLKSLKISLLTIHLVVPCFSLP
jgi:hypothetical protein